MDAGEKMQRFTRLSLNPLTIFNSLKCRPDPIITRHPHPHTRTCFTCRYIEEFGQLINFFSLFGFYLNIYPEHMKNSGLAWKFYFN